MKKIVSRITAGAIHARAHQEMPRPFLLGGAVATTRSLTAVAIDCLLVKISEVQVPQRTQNTGGTTPRHLEGAAHIVSIIPLRTCFPCLPDECSRERVCLQRSDMGRLGPQEAVFPYLIVRWMVQDVYTCIAVLSRLLRRLSSFDGSPMKSSVAFQKALSIAAGIASS